jgi:hypothetical protein
MPIPPEVAWAVAALLIVSAIGFIWFGKWKEARSQRRDEDK